jgi:hypothetical protein
MQSRYTTKHFVKLPLALNQTKILTILAIAALITFFGKPTLAAWNYQTLKDVEEQLNLFVKTLPNGKNIKAPRVFVYEGVAMTPCGEIATPFTSKLNFLKLLIRRSGIMLPMQF